MAAIERATRDAAERRAAAPLRRGGVIRLATAWIRERVMALRARGTGRDGPVERAE
jgi:hypothetical protein